MIWPQPLTLALAENMLYGGQVASAPDGSYSLAWSALNEMGIRQVFFQRFSPSGQALSPEPTSITDSIYNQALKLIRTSNGNYILLTKSPSFASVHRLDPQGNLLNTNITYGHYVWPDARLDLVPDLSGGAWLSCQTNSNPRRKINHIDAESDYASTSGLWIEPVNTLTSGTNFVPQADGTVLCGFSHGGQLRLMRVTTNLQINMDVSITTDSPDIQDTRLFQDAAGNLVWIYHKNESGDHLFRAIKTNTQGVLLWDQPLELLEPGMNYSPNSWDAIALEDGSFLFSYSYRMGNSYA
ncbi:MAG: hypothetical protein U1B83_00195, partial [Candidatus Cloacimonadaceae bacterium]|nr:hypothetical protein [Candidatus Cloacimonadaceae bacterium]